MYVFLFATVIACFGNSTAANFVFGNRAVFYIGKISFSIYLVHLFLARIVARVVAFDSAHFGRLADVVSPLVAFAVVVAAGTCFYYVVEVPGRRFMMRVLSRRTRDVGEVPAGLVPVHLSANEGDSART